MNVEKAIELSVCDALRQHGDLPTAVRLRPFQAPDSDPAWTAATDRHFPLVDIRCRPSVTEQTQETYRAECVIIVGTAAADDLSHAAVSLLYERVRRVVHALFVQARSAIDGAEMTTFRKGMATRTTGFGFGGFTLGESVAPYDAEGANLIGTALNVHYSNSEE